MIYEIDTDRGMVRVRDQLSGATVGRWWVFSLKERSGFSAIQDSVYTDGYRWPPFEAATMGDILEALMTRYEP